VLGNIASRIPNPVSAVSEGAFTARVLSRAGIIRPIRPDRLAKTGLTFARWGASPATAIKISAINYPDETALVDEVGALTFDALHRRTNAAARALGELGVGVGDGVGILCRNHRGFVEATLGAAKLGASSLFLNTAFSGPQLADVVKREGPKVLIYDEEFANLLDGVDESVKRVIAWQDTKRGKGSPDASLEDLITSTDDRDLTPPPEMPRFVILTSGTTGTPKGAQRSSPDGIGVFAGLLDKIPFRTRQRMVIAAPLFHSWGFTHFVLSLPLASTIVLRRKFDEEETLKAIEKHEADVLVVVPVMLQRILALDEKKLAKYDLPSLGIVSVSGSALPGELATRWMDHFGDNIYNLYGSTEVAYATIATPEDLREAPGTAGRVPRGTVVRLYDENDKEVPAGETGRIFVASGMAFEGYTGGGNKDVIDGFMSSGDVGHFDEAGRLFIDGRDDEMIVSGGENVFPREVEDLLSDHEAVAEAAVIGVEDEEFGQRLKAFVVLTGGKKLSPEDAKKHIKSNLAGYKVPREFEFIDELPRNATGKIVKRKLAEREEEESGRSATTGESGGGDDDS
jgi:fatty-acyl-CoA synthase